MWRSVWACVAGESHRERGEDCQDHCVVEIVGGHTFVAVAADGAGSAPRGELGAKEACSYFSRAVGVAVSKGTLNCGDPGELLKAWVSSYQEELQQKSPPIADYASTLLLAVIGRSGGFVAQIGDGLIAYAVKGGPLNAAIAPARGEYANTTFFVTDSDAVEQLHVHPVHEGVDRLVVATDGLQGIIYDCREHLVNQKFFSPIFGLLNKMDPEEAKGQENDGLSKLLLRQDIASRSEDDKTLVIASLIPPVAEEDEQGLTAETSNKRGLLPPARDGLDGLCSPPVSPDSRKPLL